MLWHPGKQLWNATMKIVLMIVGLCLLMGCASWGGGNKTTEQLLSAAGFRVYPPRDASEEAYLKTLPQRQLLSARGAVKPTYIYADDGVCDCIYVGGEAEYAQYKKLDTMKRGADARMISAQYREAYMTSMGGGGMGVMGGYW